MKKAKNAKLPFWKKDPVIASVSSHLGKIIDNTNLKDWFECLIMAGIAYGGYKIAEKNNWDYFMTIITGEIGYKLATTMGGTPPLSQIAGLSILAALGISALPLPTLPVEAYLPPPPPGPAEIYVTVPITQYPPLTPPLP